MHIFNVFQRDKHSILGIVISMQGFLGRHIKAACHIVQIVESNEQGFTLHLDVLSNMKGLVLPESNKSHLTNLVSNKQRLFGLRHKRQRKRIASKLRFAFWKNSFREVVSSFRSYGKHKINIICRFRSYGKHSNERKYTYYGIMGKIRREIDLVLLWTSVYQGCGICV